MNKESKRVLIVATVVKTHIMQFHVPTLKMFKEMGWETAVAARNDYTNPEDCQIPYCDRFYDIPFERLPFMPQNVKCYKKLKKIIDQGNYQIVHCHTPVGGVLGRLAARKAREEGTRVLYTAHGFHFYRGAPLLNWILYYSIEKFMSLYTDALITINEEDYQAGRSFYAKKVYKINGVGVDIQNFSKMDNCNALRQELSLKKEDFLLFSVGELIKRKNHLVIIEALKRIANPNIHYVIAGDGELCDFLNEKIRILQLSNQVHLLGYRTDINTLCNSADVFVLPSLQEGLSVALMEAMACAKPIIASKIRGNVDLIDDHVGGILVGPTDIDGFADAIIYSYKKQESLTNYAQYNMKKIREYDVNVVKEQLALIYNECLGE